MLGKAATSPNPWGPAPTCCASRTKKKSASPPDRFHGELCQALASRLDPAANGGGFSLRPSFDHGAYRIHLDVSTETRPSTRSWGGLPEYARAAHRDAEKTGGSGPWVTCEAG